MNWKDLLIGIGCFVAAYLLRKYDKWAYPNAIKNQDVYNIGQLFKDWILIVFLILFGIGFVFASLPDSI
jgi:uncharacterized membrane protein YoaT (DUF817 family)